MKRSHDSLRGEYGIIFLCQQCWKAGINMSLLILKLVKEGRCAMEYHRELELERTSRDHLV